MLFRSDAKIRVLEERIRELELREQELLREGKELRERGPSFYDGAERAERRRSSGFFGLKSIFRRSTSTNGQN